eukprot:3548058-Rhodomonas_salina.2
MSCHVTHSHVPRSHWQSPGLFGSSLSRADGPLWLAGTTPTQASSTDRSFTLILREQVLTSIAARRAAAAALA